MDVLGRLASYLGPKGHPLQREKGTHKEAELINTRHEYDMKTEKEVSCKQGSW